MASSRWASVALDTVARNIASTGCCETVDGIYVELYRLPVIPRCGRVDRQAHHVWGMDDAGILLSQRTWSGRAAALGTTRERAGLPAGSADREHARGDGA